MSRAKGTPKSGGRRRGTPNKNTTALKEAILYAFKAAGGRKYLSKLAKSDPKTFCRLLEKLLPAELKLDPEGATPVLIVRDYTGGSDAT